MRGPNSPLKMKFPGVNHVKCLLTWLAEDDFKPKAKESSDESISSGVEEKESESECESVLDSEGGSPIKEKVITKGLCAVVHPEDYYWPLTEQSHPTTALHGYTY